MELLDNLDKQKKSNPKGRQVQRGYQGRLLDKSTHPHLPLPNQINVIQDDQSADHFTIKYKIGCKIFLFAFYSEDLEADHLREAYRHFQFAADFDHVDAILMLSIYYLKGFESVTCDEEVAINWLIKGAKIAADMDTQLAKPAAIEWYNLIEDRNAESKEEFFSAMAKRWKAIDPKTVVILQ